MKRVIRICLTLLICLSSSMVHGKGTKFKSLCQFSYPSDERIPWSCVKLSSHDTPHKIFGQFWQEGLRFNRMDRRHFKGGVSVKVPKSMQQLSNFSPMPERYAPAARAKKFILINQTEMFLGAYEKGQLIFSAPIAVGSAGYRLKNGFYKVDAIDRHHKSNLYPMEDKGKPYPMHYGLRFFVDKSSDEWPSYWIHGRDLPGYPASHGCIGLADEEMQVQYYHDPSTPILKDAKYLYLWVIGTHLDPERMHRIGYGPTVQLIGKPPK